MPNLLTILKKHFKIPKKQRSKELKKCRKRKTIQTGGDIYKKGNIHFLLDYKAGTVLLIGVNHNECLNDKVLTWIYDTTSTQRNTVLLFEVDTRLSKKEILNMKTYDKTMDELIYLFNKNNDIDNINLEGWDFRRQLLNTGGTNAQDLLYGSRPDNTPFFLEATLYQILDLILKKLPHKPEVIKKSEASNYETKIIKYINESANKITPKTYTDAGGLFDVTVRSLGVEHWSTTPIMQLIKKPEQKMLVEKLMDELRTVFMELSDLITLKKILNKHNKYNYIIISGYYHYLNIHNHLKLMDLK